MQYFFQFKNEIMKQHQEATHVRFDWAIKRLLRNKANFVVLEGFLSELIGENIIITNCLESEGNQKTKNDKYNRVDILVQNDEKELILIEVQNESEYDYFHRMLYGSSKLVTDYIKLGQKFGQIRKIISINIVYFDLGQGNDYVYKAETEFYGIHNQQEILQLSEIQKEHIKKETIAGIFPTYYLIKVNTFNDIAIDTLDEWIYFLKNSTIKKEFTAKGLKEADKIMSIDKMTTKQRKEYMRYMENLSYEDSISTTKKIEQEERENKLRKESEEKGMKNKAKETTLKLLKKGMSNEETSEITDLEISETEILRHDVKDNKN